MPSSMHHSVLSLIYKKGDKDNIKNYRPISLSNYDYKTVAFVLAKRLQSVILKKYSCQLLKGPFAEKLGSTASLLPYGSQVVKA